jgi:ketosteroid isomerase-like protein
MSAQANVEIARRFTETLVRGDYEAAAAIVAPDFSVDDTDIPESTGADSFHEWIGRWDAAFESWRIEDLEVRSIGEDCTLSLFRIYARGTGSGIELARDDAAIAKFRDGKIVRIAYYNNQAQALEAAGLLG